MFSKGVIANFYKTPVKSREQPYGAEIHLCKMGLSLFWDQNGLDLDELEHSLCLKLTLQGPYTFLVTS